MDLSTSLTCQESKQLQLKAIWLATASINYLPAAPPSSYGNGGVGDLFLASHQLDKKPWKGLSHLRVAGAAQG